MNRFLWITALIVFVLVTLFVVSVDTSQVRRVQFNNQEFAITDGSRQVVDSGTNLVNKQISTNDSKLNLNSVDLGVKDSSNIESKNVQLYDNSTYSNQDIKLDDYEFEYDNQDAKFNTEETISFKNVDIERLDSILEDAKTVSTSPVDVSNKPIKRMNTARYQYRNIDWSTWKSEFVNKILDDSLTISSLDSYGYGAWFYYSFDVSDTGVISNINVKSMYLSDEDKKKVIRLIKSYQYHDITVFPANTNRKTAKVSAVMMLSNETKRSKPSDFNDFEQVKIKR